MWGDTLIKEISLTGNPWIDNGIAKFILDIESQPYVKIKNIPPLTYAIEIDKENQDIFKNQLNEILENSYNKSWITTREIRALQKLGLVGPIPNKKRYKLSNEEFDAIKAAQDKGNVPYFKLKEDEFNVKQPRNNLIDVKVSKSKIKKPIDDFCEEFFNESPKIECNLCGHKISKSKDIKQYTNPFSTKTHNDKIRGFSKSLRDVKGCSFCQFFGLVSFLDRSVSFYQKFEKNKPYIVIALPNILDIAILLKIKKRLEHGDPLHNLNIFKLDTNLNKFLSNDQYSLIVSLYDQLINTYGIDEDEFNELYKPLKKEEIDKIYKWTTFVALRGQATTIGSFSSIKPSENIYDFLSINDDFHPFEDILKKIKKFDSNPTGSTSSFELFSKGFVFSNIKYIINYLFDLYKNKEPNNNLFLDQDSYEYFKNVINKIYGGNIMDNGLIDDCKAFGIQIGEKLNKNIGLMTEIYNTTDYLEFKDSIEKILFTLYKMNLKGENSKVKIKESRVENILKNLNEENFNGIKSTIFIFAVLRSLNKLGGN